MPTYAKKAKCMASVCENYLFLFLLISVVLVMMAINVPPPLLLALLLLLRLFVVYSPFSISHLH